MTRSPSRPRALAPCLAVVGLVAVSAAVNASRSSAADPVTAALQSLRARPACHPGQRPVTEIAAAKLIIEYNATNNDIGVHGLFDDAGWSEICVFDPSGRQVLAVNPKAQLKALTMAGIFFESRVPPGAVFSYADLVAAFPAGAYQVRGTTFDGMALVGAAEFSHAVPAPPVITAPPLVADEELAANAVMPSAGLSVAWNDVTQTTTGGPVTITGYEVIITKVDHDDPHGFSRPLFDVHVGPGANSLGVPIEFLEPGTVYELEVLALETSGNQTISLGFFMTA